MMMRNWDGVAMSLTLTMALVSVEVDGVDDRCRRKANCVFVLTVEVKVIVAHVV